MPYIAEYRRGQLDPWIQILAERFKSVGDMNYSITRLICLSIPPRPNYAQLSAARAVLMDVYDEFTRQVLDPYENTKQREHGGVHKLGREIEIDENPAPNN